MGRSPAGENSTGDADFTKWYDGIDHLRETYFIDYLEQVYSWAGFDSETITFPSLDTPSPEEEAQIYKTTSEGDAIHLMNGTLSQEEVRSRFTDGHFSQNLVLEDNPELRDLDDTDLTLGEDDDSAQK